MDLLLPRLSCSLDQAKSLEDLVRPLLEMLEQVTHLESTYLTTIDFTHELQHVLYARNTRKMQIPEGFTVPWNDTLCKRALNEGKVYTDNVQECWGDSQAASALGIRTYISTPIRFSDGSIYGTLCAASAYSTLLPSETQSLLRLFANLISQHVEREQLLRQLQERNALLTKQALTDPLTRLPNRTALCEELTLLLGQASCVNSSVLIAFIDLDGFKQVNDVYGHAVGDRLLCEVAGRLSEALRDGDMIARIGGDEFVFISPIPIANHASSDTLSSLEERLYLASRCNLIIDTDKSLNYPGASIGLVLVNGESTVDQALKLADAAMYNNKQIRKSYARINFNF